MGISSLFSFSHTRFETISSRPCCKIFVIDPGCLVFPQPYEKETILSFNIIANLKPDQQIFSLKPSHFSKKIYLLFTTEMEKNPLILFSIKTKRYIYFSILYIKDCFPSHLSFMRVFCINHQPKNRNASS